jgi:phospholipase C
MLENRSFNHMFGAFPGATDVTKVGVVDGKETPLTVAPEWFPGDLPHDRGAAVHDVNGGAMDGFAMYDQGDVPAVDLSMSFHERDTIANWWHWAENFVLCDHVFASANSASYPNHLYMIAGTSGGAFDNPEQNAEQLAERTDKGLAKTWGCDAPDGAYVLLYDYETGDGEDVKPKGARPCFTFETQGEQLSKRKVDWAFYAANEQEDGYIWNAYSAIDQVFNTDLFDDHVRDVDDLVADIEAGDLPSVTWVTPRYELSDHPPYSTIWAQNWATEVVNAIMRSPMWDSTAIFVTWDEWGGTYDPVTPPVVDKLGLGVRVPMLVISPWANRGMIDHEVGEFSSPHRFIADNFGLPLLTDRVRNTHNFEHVFDFHRRKSGLLAPDPLPLLKAGPLPETPPKDNIAWPPPVSY